MFPKDFIWGAATAAYQIEGAHLADGKGPNVWDRFSLKPNAVYHGHTGNIACDHYHRLGEDIGLMQEIGLQAYRFSVNWARVLPNGVGTPNEKGLDFYDRLVDGLLAANIQPYCTLFHWDYPQALFERGGWLNPDSPDWFADFAGLLAERLSDRVADWFTLNEPGIFLVLGHVEGTHAPGMKYDSPDFFTILKHTFMGHGRATQALRAGAKGPCRIGFAPHSIVGIPESECEADVAAARAYTFGTNNQRKFWQQRLFVDPPVLGWPDDLVESLCKVPVFVSDEARALMKQPLDFLGVNFYTGELVNQHGIVPDSPGMPRTLFDWPIRPEGLYWAVKFHAERYGLPILVSENGLSNMDWVHEDGKVHDPQRIDFLTRYLRQLSRAAGECDVRGYFHWSLMDNFEWADGYKHRFGLIHVDYGTLARTPKDSAFWYRDVIRANGIP